MLDKAQAIAKVIDYIEETKSSYPTTNLVAERFEVGWRVFEPVAPDTPEDQYPYGRAVFLIGDDEFIMRSSSSVPPRRSIADFMAHREPGSD